MVEMDYTKYRQHMDELIFMKSKLMTIITNKRKAHSEYIKHRKLYVSLLQEEDEMVKKLMEKIPSPL